MEGWLYGLFTLFGVILGGLFSYLGMRQQLKQRSEIDSRAWRREVRGKPLLKMREELAVMATKLDKLAKCAHSIAFMSSRYVSEEQLKQAWDEASTELNRYMSGNDLELALKIVDDAEIKKKVREIRTEYLVSIDKGKIFKQELSIQQRGEAAREIEEKIDPKVTEAQALINKTLVEL